VASAIDADHIRYPVAQDNALATWNAYGNQYWPAEYLIDATGQVREANFGEGGYAATEAHSRTWTESGEAATAGTGAIIGRRGGRQGRPCRPQPAARGSRRRAGVSLDGRRRATLTVDSQRLYRLVSLPAVDEHLVSLRLSPGVGAYSFTFA
jgi:hypothetical protein